MGTGDLNQERKLGFGGRFLLLWVVGILADALVHHNDLHGPELLLMLPLLVAGGALWALLFALATHDWKAREPGGSSSQMPRPASGPGAYYPGRRLSLASDTAIRRRASGWSSAGSFLLLLAAVCAAPMAPGVAAGHNGPALKTAKMQPAAIRAKLLGRLSMARRQALGAGARELFASVLGMPASLAYTATCEAGSGRAAQPAPEATPRTGHAPQLDARPPPFSLPLV